MDRIRNARHFAPRLQRWLDDLATAVKPAPQDAASDAARQQLDLFGQEAATPSPSAATPHTANLLRTPETASPPTRPGALSWTPPVTITPAAPPTAIPVRPSAPPPPSELPPKRQLLVGQFVLEYTLRRSTRRSIGFMIDDDGLRVTAPKRVSITEIDNAIRTKQHWILSKLHERRERRAARLEKPPIEWGDGAQLP